MSTNRYKALFPRCVDGENYRSPLRDPAREGVGLRMDEIYSTAELSNVERANLLVLYHALRMTMSHVQNGPTLAGVTGELKEFERRNGLGNQSEDEI